MKLAILSDIHSNLQALTACLAHAERQGADRYAFLGDLVGYGADPCACLELIRAHAERGAIVVRGNHDDAALGGLCAEMNFVAREAIVWTRTQLGPTERDFVAALPYAAVDGRRLFVHASAHQPTDWEYIVGEASAQRCLDACAADLVCVGHVHQPMLYYSLRERVGAFLPQPGMPVTLTPGRRWLALVGSVGQPRDGNAAAAYALLDDSRQQLSFFRIPYDWMTAAARIRAAGLPGELAARLEGSQ